MGTCPASQKLLAYMGTISFSLEISKFSLALKPLVLVNTSGRVQFSSPADPAFLINFHASFFWFCTIFSKEDSWFFYFCCVLFHFCSLCVRKSAEHIVKCLFVLWLQVRIQRGTGDPNPPGKSQVIWVTTGNKQLDPPPPPEKVDPPPPPGKFWTPSGTLKMIDFFGINHLTSVK